ncbi:AAA family ATPase [Bacillus marasmi]|uniref:AAA family ATPase n=1 Tax=Bacillus marasmi TaxID=1926279 RepID=UPI0011C7F42C|nr:AAA family ATPase [Bacillus marasmi]
MNLLKLKLLSDYSIFSKGADFYFNNSKILAIVGVNGSGKSKFQEMIVNAFLNLYARLNNYKIYEQLDFELDYLLALTPQTYSLIANKDNENLKYDDINEIIVKAKVKSDELFSFNIFIKLRSSELVPLKVEREKLKHFLPNALVVYSSGENETISNELLRYRFYNQNRYLDNMYNQIITDINNMKLEYVHESYRALLITSMLLFNSEKIRRLKDLLNLERISFIKVDINFSYRGKQIELPSMESLEVRKLLSFSNEIEDSKMEGNYDIIFQNNYERLEDHYLNNPTNIYRTFEFLENLNLLKISKKKRKLIEQELHYAIKDIHSYFSTEKKVFSLRDCLITKSDKSIVSILDLSDGEFQLLLISSLLLIHDSPNTLFILDEPDTHFNPEWKSKFLSIISMIKSQNSQCLFTTHNPEVLTDIRSEDIIFIKNGIVETIDIHTFGTNPNIIASSIFNKSDTVSEIAMQAYKRYLGLIEREEDIQKLLQIEQEVAENFGNSAERMMLLNKIYKKQRV